MRGKQMKTVDELLQELKDLRVRKKSFDGSYYNIEVIDSDGFNMVENIIREFLLDHHDGEIGEMQGKIFAYEEIIKKSNFAPFIDSSQLIADNLQLRENIVRLQNANTNYDIEKVKKELEETEEPTVEETMFYSEFRKSDDFENTDCIYWFDLSGNVVMPDMGDKILKYYRYKSGDLNIMIAFIEKLQRGERA